VDSLLQLLQAILLVLAAGAAIFSGQFSRMRAKQFNEVSKFMLIVSLVLIVGSDLLNFIPALQITTFGIGSLFNGDMVGNIILYGIIEIAIYTGLAYAFSYFMLTKDKLREVYEWSEDFVKHWKQEQNQTGIAQRLQEPEVPDEFTRLQRLHALRQKGVITEEEYQSKKKQLLKL
jgi:hypothetical protein